MSIKPPLYEPIGAFCSLESASAAAQMSLAGGKVKPGWALAIFGSYEEGYELVQYPLDRGEVSNLVERLRKLAELPSTEPVSVDTFVHVDLHAAADRLEKLEKALREIADCGERWSAIHARKALEE